MNPHTKILHIPSTKSVRRYLGSVVVGDSDWYGDGDVDADAVGDTDADGVWLVCWCW